MQGDMSRELQDLVLGLGFRAEVLRIEEFTVSVEFSIIEEKFLDNPYRT